MAFVLQVDQKVGVSISPMDAAGNPARVDGTPVWNASDAGALVTVVPALDGMSAVMTPVGPIGTLQVSVTVDADLGAGVRALVGVLDVELVGGEAVVVNIMPGTPEPK